MPLISCQPDVRPIANATPLLATPTNALRPTPTIASAAAEAAAVIATDVASASTGDPTIVATLPEPIASMTAGAVASDLSLANDPPVAATATAWPTDTGWEQLSPGLERRVFNLLEPGRDFPLEIVYVLRLAPEQFTFDIGYRPGSSQLLTDWQAETGALIVMNGGFFTEELTATGLTILDGQPSGSSYGPFAGMVTMTEGVVDVRWLSERPWQVGEPIDDALQSFPMLVLPGGQLGFPADKETGRRARRTVIGRDSAGRILLIVTPRGHFTLHQLSDYLVQSDLDLDIALNLDGGPSTGLLLKDGAFEEGHLAYLPLPIVITVSRP